jgi:hypothetical protein
MEPSKTRTTPPPLTFFLPTPRCGCEAHVSKPCLAGGLTSWALNPSVTRGTHTTASPAARGDTAMTPRGQGQRRPEAARVTCR